MRRKTSKLLQQGGLVLLLVSCLHTDLALAQCQGEIQRAEAIRQRIESEWPLRPADEVTGFVRRFGQQLAVRAGTDPQLWHFDIVRDLHPNAYSIGNGFIYLTEGALLLARDHTELAAMIAHEMGHQLSGHFCPARKRKGGWLDWVPNVFGPTSGAGQKTDNGDERVYKGTLRQGWDPEKERDADGYAKRLLSTAGYDAGAMDRLEWRLRAATPTTSHGINPPAPSTGGWTGELLRIQQLLRRTGPN